MQKIAQKLIVLPIRDPIDMIFWALPMQFFFPDRPYIFLTRGAGLERDENEEDNFCVIGHRGVNCLSAMHEWQTVVA